jgi:hypothetical protein
MNSSSIFKLKPVFQLKKVHGSRVMYRKFQFYRYSDYGTRLASRVMGEKEHGSCQKQHGSLPKPGSFSAEPCTSSRYTALAPGTFDSTARMPRRAGLFPLVPSGNRLWARIPPPTPVRRRASTARQTYLGIRDANRGPRSSAAGLGQKRIKGSPLGLSSPSRS